MLVSNFGYPHFILSVVPRFIKQIEHNFDETIFYTKSDFLINFTYFLRDHTSTLFKTLIDVTCVDFPDRSKRFEVVYNLLSLKYNKRIRIKVLTNDYEPIPSLFPIYSSATWHEREVWDLYGVFFENHNDLRRILTDYGFQNHPFRKDFPLSGYYQLRFDAEVNQIVFEKTSLLQQSRMFDFKSPWGQYIKNQHS